MLVSDFDYSLPPERIAQQPLADREAARMLVVERATGALHDSAFRELPRWLRAGDLVVVNNTRVIRARLFGHRAGVRAQPLSPHNPASRDFLKGQVEVFLTRQLSADTWHALVRPGRKIRVGERLFFDEGLEAEVLEHGEFGERTLRFHFTGDFLALLDRIGHVPLPPYIHRPDQAADAESYQTVYARQPGSVAAPTAGLHFTPAMFERLREAGIEIAEITLHVGLGTFQPIHAERVEDHVMHAESFHISADAAAAIQRARRIIAVGTTTVRTLESTGTGETRLFIYPGFQFSVVGGMLTNFHLPRSTLLMLVCAFGGQDLILRAYRHAVDHGGYRFFSYGDCMLVV